jgi:hypothetical protein
MLRPCGAPRRILEGTRQSRAKNKKRACIFSDTSGHPVCFFSDRKKRGGATCYFKITCSRAHGQPELAKRHLCHQVSRTVRRRVGHQSNTSPSKKFNIVLMSSVTVVPGALGLATAPVHSAAHRCADSNGLTLLSLSAQSPQVDTPE